MRRRPYVVAMGAISPSVRDSLRAEADAYSDAAERVRYYGSLAKREEGVDGMSRLGAHRALSHAAVLLDREASARRRDKDRWSY